MKSYLIGRFPEADIVLLSSLCSRNHAKITITNHGKVILEDCSSNGTIVNSKKIINQSLEIKYGDEVIFGGVEKLDWSKIEKPIQESKLIPPPQPFVPTFKLGILPIVLIVLSLIITTGMWYLKSNELGVFKRTILTASEIYEKNKNSVALVEVKFYVRIKTSNKDLYFGYDSDKEITMDIDKYKLTPFKSEGTAFFIDSQGTLITNKHVIAPWHYDKSLSNHFYKKELPVIERLFKENGWGVVDRNITGALESISIYTNGEIFTNENKIACKEHKISDDEDIDLASIKTIDGKTPKTVTIISVKQIQKKEKEIKINSPAYVIGYPMGDNLAVNENNEIHCTSTQGSFTQNPSTNYIQYSAPSAGGASGSPVFDEFGNLVAINYMSMGSGQSFNRGILAKHLDMVK